MPRVYINQITSELAVVQLIGGLYHMEYFCQVEWKMRIIRVELEPERWGWSFVSDF